MTELSKVGKQKDGEGKKEEENISQPFLHKVYVVWYWLFMLPTEMQSRHHYGTMEI